MTPAPRRPSKRVRANAAAKAPPDRHALYELCAQNPTRDVRMLRAMHGGDPRILGEDFSGTAALSRAWTAMSPEMKAVAVDHDPEPLSLARGAPRVKVVQGDVMSASDPADIIGVLNFSICEIHARRVLVKYLRHARSRLKAGGVFVADIYDGADAFLTGRIVQYVKAPWSPRGAKGGRVRYEWEQRHADLLTGRVINAMHFGATWGGRRLRFEDAFVYDWRLWSIRELRDAMVDAGFGVTEVYPRTADAMDADGNLYVQPVEDPLDLGDSFSAYVVGRR